MRLFVVKLILSYKQKMLSEVKISQKLKYALKNFDINSMSSQAQTSQ